MRNQLYLLIGLLFLSLLSPAMADDFDDYGLGKRLLVINPMVSNLELTDVEKRMINKVTIKVCAKQKGYQIALGEIGIAKSAGFGISNLELSVTTQPDGIEVKAVLLDEIKKQVLGIYTLKRVDRLHLMRTIETALDSVFNQRKN